MLDQIAGPDCKVDFDTKGGVLIYVFLMLYSFWILAKLCDGHLTRSLEVIVERLGLSEDVAGATFLAMASSAPELFCSVIATFVMENPSGVGNIVGSALFNLLCIIGVLPVVSKTGPLAIWWYPTARDSMFYLIAILEMFIFIEDGRILMYEALVMCFSYAAYVAYFTRNEWIVERLGLVVPDEAGVDASDEPDAEDTEAEKPEAEKPEAEVEETVVCPTAISVVLDNGLEKEPDVKTVEDSQAPLEKVDVSQISDTDGHCGRVLSEREDLDYVHLGWLPFGSGAGQHKPPVLTAELVAAPTPTSLETVREEKMTAPAPPLVEALPCATVHGAALSNDCPSDMGGVSETSKSCIKDAAKDTDRQVAQRQSKGRVSHRGGSAEGCVSSGASAMRAVRRASSVNGPPLPSADKIDEETGEEESVRQCPTEPMMFIIDLCMPTQETWIISSFGVCSLWIAGFTYFMVDSATRVGCVIDVPITVMSLIVLAAGTSVPDMIASMAVAREGHADMAAANAVGSNTFDILLGLGFPWLIATMAGKEIEVPKQQIQEALSILLASLLIYVAALAANKWMLDRKIGILLLLIYAGSIAFTLVRHYTWYAEGQPGYSEAGGGH